MGINPACVRICHPDMSLKNFLQETESGLKSPVYLLYADSQYLVEEALSIIKKTVPEGDVDFNFSIYDIDSPDAPPTPEDIITTLNTVPFLGSRRYVIVKNLQKLPAKESKKLFPYIANPSPDSLLVMLYAGALKKDMKENLRGAKSICLDIREQDLPFWIKEKARQKGFAIKDEAVEYLIGIVGADAGLLSSEMEKLASFGSGEITVNTIREVVEGSREYSVFDLTNALREKNPEKVFRIYSVISETAEPYSLLGAINWQYSKLSAQSNGGEFYRKVFELLNEADIQIKTSGGAYPMEYLLARLLKL